jgi:hypothetical protein
MESGMNILEQFKLLQRQIEEDQSQWAEIDREWLMVSEMDGHLSIDFYASPFGEHFEHLLNLLSRAEIASQVRHLVFHSPIDDGANGTRCWDFSALLDTSVVFPNLVRLWIEQYNTGDHNHPIIGTRTTYEERGLLARWLSKAPRLASLSAPSAPNMAFFERSIHPLHELNIQAGYDTEEFVLNFTQSTCFPELWLFEYQDYNEDYVDSHGYNHTPLSHFQGLFQSPAFDSVRHFVWHNPIFTMEELSSLKVLRPRLAFKIARFSSEYLR